MVAIVEPDRRSDLGGSPTAETSHGQSRSAQGRRVEHRFSRRARLVWRAQTAGWLLGALFSIVSRILAFDVGFAFALTAVLEPLGFALTTLGIAHRMFRNRISGITLTAGRSGGSRLSIAGGVLQMLVANGPRYPATRHRTQPWCKRRCDPGNLLYLDLPGWSLSYLWIKADADARRKAASSAPPGPGRGVAGGV